MNELRRHRFRSMGTTVRLVAQPHPAFDRTARAIEAAFAAADRRFSRFRPDSELSRVNAAAGRPTRVSDDFAEVLSLALEGAWVTGGLFDPTILEALRAAGYDRDFAQIRRTTVRSTPLAPGGVRWSDVRWEPAARTLRLPAGAGLDFGGVAKGWAVDVAAKAAHDLPWAIVDAGGDLCVTGSVPEDGLEIAVEDPRARGTEMLRLNLREGALATSSVTSRVWGPGLHQLIDPRTGRPAATEAIQATAWAPTCAEAEIRAKWLLLEGAAALAQVSGVIAFDDGRLVTNVDQDTERLKVVA